MTLCMHGLRVGSPSPLIFHVQLTSILRGAWARTNKARLSVYAQQAQSG